MEFRRSVARIVMPVLLLCAVYGCSSSGQVSEDTAQATNVASAAGDDSQSQMTPEEFVAGQNLAEEDGNDSADDVICRRIKPVGSHFSKTVCVTRAEKRKQADESRDFMKSMPPAIARPIN